MYNSTVETHYALANMNIKAALSNGDVECSEYRYTVFPNYRAFLREVFVAYPGAYNTTRMSILSPLKEEAINMIVSARNKAALQTETIETVTTVANETQSEIAELKAEIAELKALVEKQTKLNANLVANVSNIQAQLKKGKSQVQAARKVLLNGKIVNVPAVSEVCFS
jgi:uncharacterized coiled-coil protein SlyX